MCWTGEGNRIHDGPVRPSRHLVHVVDGQWRTPDNPARLHPEPDLVRHRDSRGRDHRLDADARPDPSPGPPVGAKTPATTPIHHPRDPGPHRPEGPAPPREHLTLGRPAQRRRPPTPRPGPAQLDTTNLTRRTPQHPRQWKPAPSRDDNGRPVTPQCHNQPSTTRPRRAHQHHPTRERSR